MYCDAVEFPQLQLLQVCKLSISEFLMTFFWGFRTITDYCMRMEYCNKTHRFNICHPLLHISVQRSIIRHCFDVLRGTKTWFYIILRSQTNNVLTFFLKTFVKQWLMMVRWTEIHNIGWQISKCCVCLLYFTCVQYNTAEWARLTNNYTPWNTALLKNLLVAQQVTCCSFCGTRSFISMLRNHD